MLTGLIHCKNGGLYLIGLKNKNVVYCLWETHIRIKDQRLIKNKNLGEDFSSLSHQKKKGMAVYIKKKLYPKLKFVDPDGWFVVV